MKEKAEEYRNKLIDAIVEQDDEVLEKYFEVRWKLQATAASISAMFTFGKK